DYNIVRRGPYTSTFRRPKSAWRLVPGYHAGLLLLLGMGVPALRLPWGDGMYKQTAALLTASIDEITRKWVEELRRNTRTEVHKHLLTADIVDGVKAILASLAKAIEAHEVPEDEAELHGVP